MQLAQPNSTAVPLNQKVSDFRMDGGKVKTDNSALNLVIQDLERAEKFIMARLWMSEWRVAKSLYEAPVRQTYWRDTLVPRSSNSFPLVAQHVRAILDQAMPAIWPGATPFSVEPTSAPRQVSRGWTKILSKQLKQVNAKAQLRLIVKDAEIFGTGIGKFGWETYTKNRTVFKRDQMPKEIPSPIPGGKSTFIHTKESDELVETEVPETISQPYFKRVEINHILVAPGTREPDIREAAYVVYREYPTIRDLNKLRDFEGYNIPSEAELRSLAEPPEESAPSSVLENEGTAYPTQGHRPLPRYIDESEDPLEHKLEMLEYWTADVCIVVLQRKLVIRNIGNPFGQIPFVSCYWDDIPGTFYSYGIPRRIGGVQMHIQGLRNTRLDDVHMNLMKMWKVKKGSNIASQPIRMYPGACFKVDDMANFEPLQVSPVLQEAYKEEEVLIGDAERTTGANPLYTQGSNAAPGVGTGSRTATGAAAASSAASTRVQSFVDIVCDQVLVPLLYSFLKMDRLWLDPAIMRKICGRTLWQAMEQDHEGDLLVDMCNNSDLEFNLLAGSNLAAKQKMAQSLPVYGEMMQAAAVTQGLADANMKFNWVEFSRRWEEVTGWDSPEDMFIPLTPQEKQQKAAANPKVIDAKATQSRLAQMHGNKMQENEQLNQHKLQQIDAQATASTGQDVLTRSFERSMEREETPQLVAGLQGLGNEG